MNTLTIEPCAPVSPAAESDSTHSTFYSQRPYAMNAI
jgi:hypothetical protein